MSTAVPEVGHAEGPSTAESLLRTWQGLDVPDGWRAEIVDYGVTLVPPPSNPHNLIADLAQEVLFSAKPAGSGIYQTLGLWIEPLAKLYVPDLVVMPRAVVRECRAPAPAEEASAVVEITSKDNADADRKKKLWGYAHAPVPLYLLIDAWDENGPSVTLFEHPGAGRYHRTTTVGFGETITLPEPFTVTLDTAEYPLPEDWA